jgi:hypothetical protein
MLAYLRRPILLNGSNLYRECERKPERCVDMTNWQSSISMVYVDLTAGMTRSFFKRELQK